MESAGYERRCKYCAEKLTEGTVVCPVCRTPYVPEDPEHEITVLVSFSSWSDHSPCPELIPVTISSRAKAADLMARILQLGIIHDRSYYERGIIRRLEDVPVLSSDDCKVYRSYRHGDIVLFRREVKASDPEDIDWVLMGADRPPEEWDLDE